MFVFFVLLMMVLIGALIGLQPMNLLSGAESAYVWIILGFFSLLLLLHRLYLRDPSVSPRHGISPMAVMLIVLAISIGFGTLNYFLVVHYLNPSFPGNPNKALTYALLGVITMMLTFMLSLKLLLLITRTRTPRSPKQQQVAPVWDVKKLRILVHIGFWLTLFGLGYVYATIGYIPITLEAATGQERSQISSQLLTLTYFFDLGIVEIILASIYLIIRRRLEVTILVMLMITTFLVLGLGARFFILFPILLLILTYRNYGGTLKYRRLVIGFIVYLLLSTLYLSLRGDPFIRMVSASSLPWYVRLAITNFPEFQDYIRIVDYYPYQNGGITLLPAVLSLIPKELWSVFNVDKLYYLSFTSSYLIQDFLSAGSPIRVGIFGEFYMNFGLNGIIVGMGILGVVSGLLEYLYILTPKSAGRLVILNFFTAVLAYTIVGQFGAVGALISGTGYPLLICYFICRRRQSVARSTDSVKASQRKLWTYPAID